MNLDFLEVDALFIGFNSFFSKNNSIKSGGELYLKNKYLLVSSPLETHEGVEVILLNKEFNDKFSKLKIIRLGVIGSEFTLKDISLFKGVEIVDVEDKLLKLSEIKNVDEVDMIRTSCEHTIICFNKIINNFKFKHESEVVKFIKQYSLENNLELAFDPIVASGVDSSKPHYHGSKKITEGFLVLDFGFKYEGYCSDMTRTIFIGTPSKDELDLYESVLTVQKQCIDQLLIGKKYSEIDAFARSKLKMPHSLGHGIGRKVHELPKISPVSLDEVKLNQVITIEPGTYLNQGIRIEDTIVITTKGPIVLTNASKDFFCTKL